MNNAIEYYRAHGTYTELKEEKELTDAISSDIADLVRIVQGNMIHAHWLPRYGLDIPEERRQREMNIRMFAERVKNIRDIAGGLSMKEPHPKEKRSIGTCRDFTVALTALLREKGIPARELCGFATYFSPGRYEDHWICEWWNEKENRWVLTDPQIDQLQKDALGIDFNTLDMPRDHFVTGARAWRMCREKKHDPSLFGIFEYHGMDFIKGNLIRQVAALNKIPLLPWDCWGLINAGYDSMKENDLSFLDELARMADDPDSNSGTIQSLYAKDSRIRMQGTVTSYCGPRANNVTTPAE
ncbi:MAG TPA: transglutaminase-like domain-containing protein [Spirochaetota bacterium]|nr:transglutaminase-like domain-containing protein [Spirochaetota bacterium]